MSSKKTVLIVDAELPIGLVVNAGAILGMAFSSHLSRPVCRTLTDADGEIHYGLHDLPVPVLSAERAQLRDIAVMCRELARNQACDLFMIDLTDAAQTSHTYELYAERLAEMPSDALMYRALLINGKHKRVEKFTKDLKLYGS